MVKIVPIIEKEISLTEEGEKTSIRYWSKHKGHPDRFLHREDGPAVIYDGGERWYQYGRIHRIDGPASTEGHNRLKEWFVNGQRHRVDGPAVIDSEYGHEEWWLYDRLHRANNLPAIIHTNGVYEYYINGKLHRTNGPAMMSSNYFHWYINNEDITLEVKEWMDLNDISWPFSEEHQLQFSLRWL